MNNPPKHAKIVARIPITRGINDRCGDGAGELVKEGVLGATTSRVYPNCRFDDTIKHAMRVWLVALVLACHGSAPPAADVERHDLPVSAQDIAILDRADAILASEAVWNRADTRDCPAGATKFSLFCALHDASIEILGAYDHRRASLQEVRFVIEERGKDYEHRLLGPGDRRLMGFNNDPATSFADVKHVLAGARVRVQRRVK